MCVLYRSVYWPGQRRVTIASNEDACSNGTGSLAWFGDFTAINVQSRMIATRPLDLQYNSTCGESVTHWPNNV